MKITKLGHCCLVIREKALTILTDPGSFTTAQNEVTGIDVILITHEHADHLHIESLKQVLEHNSQAKIITNKSVGKILDRERIAYTVVEDGQELMIDSVLFQGFGTTHAEIYPSITPVENTGYFINKRLFYPGDALYDPKLPIDILALPVVAPWVKISEVIDYARALKPKLAFPVHDGMLNQFGAFYHQLAQKFLQEIGSEYKVLELGVEIEL